MTEQKTAQQQVREQVKAVETNAQNIMGVWDETFFATTELTFDLFERALRHNRDLGGQSERMVNDTLATYHSFYRDGFKSWQAYLKGIREAGSRTL